MKYLGLMLIFYSFLCWSQENNGAEDEALLTETEIAQEQENIDSVDKELSLDASDENSTSSGETEVGQTPNEDVGEVDTVSDEASKDSTDFQDVTPESVENTELVEPIEVQEEVSNPEPTEIESVVENHQQSASLRSGDFEARLNAIYNQFYRETISDDSWKQIAGERINETYTIQNGDTLWDISVTFFGNGHYWPKVWQLNDDITNPHELTSGYQLKFVPGTLQSSSQLKLTEASEAEPIETQVVSEGADQTDLELTPVVPPPTKKSRAVLQNLPASLPFIKNKKYQQFDENGFSMKSVTSKENVSGVYLTSYLTDTKPVSLGTVGEMDIAEIQTAALYDHIYLKLSSDIPVNEKLLIYNIGESISSPKGDSGVQVFCSGEVRILEKKSDNIYKALVTKSIAPIKVGDFVTQGSIPYVNTDDMGELGSAYGKIVGGDYEKERYHMGQQQILYIDKGSEEGVQTGQIYYVKKDFKTRDSSSILKDLYSQIAKIKVVKTDAKFATAVVLSSKEDIRPGDLFASAQSSGDQESPSINSVENFESSSDIPDTGVDEESSDELDAE